MTPGASRRGPKLERESIAMNDRALLPDPLRPRSPRSRAAALAAALALCAPAALGQGALQTGHNPPVQLLRGGHAPAGGALAGTFTTIQAAVDAASPGDTVLIPAGLFTGPGNRAVSVDKNLSLIGAGQGQTIIDCEGAARGFSFNGAFTTPLLEGLTIRNGTGVDGGGITALLGSPSLRDLEIHGCSASQSGGAIHAVLNRVWDADGLYLHDNSAAQSGGAITTTQPSGTLRNLRIENNTSGVVGGGIAISSTPGMDPAGSVVRIETSLFRGNSASASGGALYSEFSDLYFVDRCTFVENTAGTVGGAIEVFGDFLLPSSDVVFFQNCVIARNQAPSGAGLHMAVCSLIVQNCTITDNVASTHTGGLLAVGDGLFLLNTILWGNTAPDPSLQVQQVDFAGTNPALLLVFYNDIEGGVPGPTNISADPLFVAPRSGDYHLGVGSPCINQGLPAFNFVLGQMDIDGQPRIIGNEIDIGADERLVDRRPKPFAGAPQGR